MTKKKLTNQQKRRIKQNIHQQLLDSHDLSQSKGRVISHFSETIDVESISGEIIRCFQKRNLPRIVTGDYVRFSYDTSKSTEGLIHAVCQRQNLLERPQTHGKNKVVAANIDQVCIVIATEPEPIGHYIDRYLIATYNQELLPIIILNKIDLGISDAINYLIKRYKLLGYKIVSTSAVDETQLPLLEDILKDKTSIFVGQSGVGKSALLNKLFDKNITKTGDISQANKRGKHTTTSARLYHLPKGGDLIDSPGIRQFGIWHLSESTILNGFSEFRPFIGLCKFRNCNHQATTPGCALIQAVDEGKIDQQRLTNYHRLIAELHENQKT
ncbi:small ribosomal subunit biogenesis GTPase RsgA [Thiotrichales bacterium 19S3-7]|nr:small ribosomal subunit biogenesis GTPase RsgA [Thiotrichales bacterium 19S3-7]MCF6800809.1 small ribosomal subunit biogenesis GTPase RsgA [Thiotrichales bacterium 19S3-11]